ncbi:MAG TPA: SIS domain-containing protein [Candidatus Limnocylindrales bacterium]
MTLRDEIFEQPAVIARLLDRGREPIARVARAVNERDPDHVVIAARGTSDHAAIYAQYLLGVAHRLPVALATPSIRSLYGVDPRFGRALVIGISQSGASPDVVGIVDAARRQGAPTIAITNDPASPLASAAEHVIDLGAGPERSIAATKTYTAELTAVAVLSAAMSGDPVPPALEVIPAAVERALASEHEARAIAGELAGIAMCTVLGRGFEYASAREWALKLKELAQVLADPYSTADFRHGPLALIATGWPVLAIVPSGPVAAETGPLLARLTAAGAEVLAVSDDADIRRGARRAIALPDGIAPEYTPIVSIVPAQLFALHLSLARGLDPEGPPHIAKVTLTS